METKNILTGYRHPSIKLYKTRIRPIGYVVGATGIASLIIAAIPNGLGIIFYPLGFSLLGLIGINPMKSKKKILNKIRFIMWRIK